MQSPRTPDTALWRSVIRKTNIVSQRLPRPAEWRFGFGNEWPSVPFPDAF